MPIYEYRCAKCGQEHEALQKITEAPLKVCPACGEEALSKLVSAAGFQLKGSGWYVTDFRNPSKPSPSKKDAKVDGNSPTGESKPDAGAPTDTKSTEAKPAESKSAESPAPTSAGTTAS